MVAAMAGRPVGRPPSQVTGISSTAGRFRPATPSSPSGRQLRRPRFRSTGAGRGRVEAVVSTRRLAAFGDVAGSLIVVNDVLAALEALWSGRRGAERRQDRRDHRQRRQDRYQGDARPCARQGGGGALFAGLVQQSLGGAADARPDAGKCPVRHLRDRHEPRRRDRAAGRDGPAACRDRHHGRAGASRVLRQRRGDRPGQGGDLPRAGARRRRRDQRRQPLCRAARIRGPDGGRRADRRFGEAAGAEARLEVAKLKPECSCVSAELLGERLTYKLGAPGRHIVQNSLAVLAAVVLIGGDLASAALALGSFGAPKGRGARHRLSLPGGGKVTLIDESYNANPASMRAAIALLGQAEPARQGRRVAVLGDMRELGPAGPELHAGLAADLACRRCRPGLSRRAADARAPRRLAHGAAGRLCRGRGRPRANGRRRQSNRGT